MKRLLASLILLVGGPAHAQFENQITVLGVVLPGADNAIANSFLADVADEDYYTYLNDAGGVTVRLANFGVLLPMPGPMTSTGTGSLPDQLDDAHDDALTHGIRKDADVILYFTGQASMHCGYAPAKWLEGGGINGGGLPIGARWTPNGFGLDLNGSEDSFEAIVNTSTGCTSDTAIHEMGHLLGGAHKYPVNSGPFSYSRAALVNSQNLPFQTTYRTIMSESTGGFLVKRWSRPGDFWRYVIPNGYHNWQTVQTTAMSVANYRILPPPPDPPTTPPPPLPPGCTLQAPTNLTLGPPAVCAPYPYTRYDVWVTDLCPGASETYKWEHQQPAGVGAWQTTGVTLFPWQGVLINGAPGNIRVRACNNNGATCSAPSPTALITDYC